MSYGWEKDQAENQRKEAIEKRAEEDKRMQRNAQSGFDGRSTDHKIYTDKFNNS